MRKNPNYWSEAQIASDLLPICNGTGIFPSNSELVGLGRGDLANAIQKNGGFIHWAKRLGFERKTSDSDKGWNGESDCLKILESKGFKCIRPAGVKVPYDLVVNEYTRVDVKTATFAEYGACRGWFYRIGKHQTADIVMLYQSDTKDTYFIPWSLCPTTNITISRGGGKYSNFLNNFDVVKVIAKMRQRESEKFSWMIPCQKR